MFLCIFIFWDVFWGSKPPWLKNVTVKEVRTFFLACQEFFELGHGQNQTPLSEILATPLSSILRRFHETALHNSATALQKSSMLIIITDQIENNKMLRDILRPIFPFRVWKPQLKLNINSDVIFHRRSNTPKLKTPNTPRSTFSILSEPFIVN